MDIAPILLSLELAGVSTLILLLIGIPLAYWMSIQSRKAKFILKTLVSLPLVLPPSVLGFYFLILFSPENSLGTILKYYFNIQLIFSFEGLVFASVIFNLPFILNPLVSGFENFPTRLIESAYSLGKTEFQTIWFVIIPQLRNTIWSATSLTFAHIMGEFGLVLMIGGNIPYQTRVASIAIYEEVELLHYKEANAYALILFAISFVILLISNIFEYKKLNLK